MEKPFRIHPYPLKGGITATPEFAKKKLADFAVNPGLKCGHGCLYCSSGAMLRTHKAFGQLRENPFQFGYAIVDPSTPQRIAKDAVKIKRRGMIQLCTTVDAWAQEAQEHNLGRQCLQTILAQPGWTVRILTKNAAVSQDFDLIEQYRNRVLVGLSITATPEKDEIVNILEPNASSIKDRMSAMVEAAARGLRTYGMLCPLLPGIANSPEQIDMLVKFAVDCRAEEIFAEPVNPRGPGLKLCQQALQTWGYETEAKSIEKIRNRKNWSRYVVNLVKHVQQAIRRYTDISTLRFLLYPAGLTPEDRAEILNDDAGVIWLK